MVGFFLYLEMQAEVDFLGCLSHPNLVKLLGLDQAELCGKEWSELHSRKLLNFRMGQITLG